MRFSISLLCTFLLALATGCDKPDPPTPGRRPSPIPPSYGFSPMLLGGQKNYQDSFAVYTPESWTLSIPTSASWLKTDATQGVGDKIIHLTVLEENTSGASRTANLTFTRTGTTETLSTLTIELLPQPVPNPSIVWSRLYGGTGDERFSKIVRTPNGYLAAGYTTSTDGDMSVTYPGSDTWVLRIDEQGGKVWQTVLGGNGFESLSALAAAPDGGCLVGGYTSSSAGTLTMKGLMGDGWVAKINSSGVLQWQKALGGSGYDVVHAIVANADGSCLVALSTESKDGDVSGSKGYADIWLVKLDAAGNVVWKQTYGGTSAEYASDLITTAGGYVFTGYTSSNDGEVSGLKGYDDFWVVRIDHDGKILWQKTLGGSYTDRPRALVESTDGGYVVCGHTNSKDGDVNASFGYDDIWVAKVDASGKLLWGRTIGGTDSEYAHALTNNGKGGFLVTGISESKDGSLATKTSRGSYRVNDAFLAELGSDGVLTQKQMLGGIYNDGLSSLVANGDNTFTLAGGSESNEGDLSGKKGKNDAWILKVKGW